MIVQPSALYVAVTLSPAAVNVIVVKPLAVVGVIVTELPEPAPVEST